MIFRYYLAKQVSYLREIACNPKVFITKGMYPSIDPSPEKESNGKALPLLVRTRAGLQSEDSAKLPKHPGLGGYKPF